MLHGMREWYRLQCLPCVAHSRYHRMDNNLQQKTIREDRKRLQNPYAHVMGDGSFDALSHGSTAINDHADRASRLESVIDLGSIRSKVNKGGRLTRRRIESVARKLQAELWRARDKLFPDEREVSPLAVLDPFLALRCIGFESKRVDSLGQHPWDHFEVAGTIDASEQAVEISRRFEAPFRKFTAAHELGHVLLHEAQGLHRDRALDGSEPSIPRDRTEWEADVFATYFLMPEKQVRAAFERAFKAPVFVLNEETAFALTAGDLEALRATLSEVRDLSRLLARTAQYDGVQFYSLAEQFGVSVETMAIRLEELRLVDL